MHSEPPDPIEGEATEIRPGDVAEPSPQGPVIPVEPSKVQVQCGGCKRNFEFPVEPGLEQFEFTCNSCGSHNQVQIG